MHVDLEPHVYAALSALSVEQRERALSFGTRLAVIRVEVLSESGEPLKPTKFLRALSMVDRGRATWVQEHPPTIQLKTPQ